MFHETDGARLWLEWADSAWRRAQRGGEIAARVFVALERFIAIDIAPLPRMSINGHGLLAWNVSSHVYGSNECEALLFLQKAQIADDGE
jgi:hypothetical protein